MPEPNYEKFAEDLTAQGFTKVQLETRHGEFVHHGWVPPFNELPGVLIWGQRFFVIFDGGTLYPNTTPIYRERFTYALVPVAELEAIRGTPNELTISNQYRDEPMPVDFPPRAKP